MDLSKVWDFVKTVAGHAAAGFAAGFLGAQVVTTPDNWQFALQTMAFWGAIGALKSVLAYVETLQPQPKTTGTKGIRVNGTDAKGLSKYFMG